LATPLTSPADPTRGLGIEQSYKLPAAIDFSAFYLLFRAF